MTLFGFAKRHNSAPIARERLKILLEYDRSIASQKDLAVVLRGEILAVVARHILFEPGKVQVRVDRGTEISKLEVDIEFPNTGRTATACA